MNLIFARSAAGRAANRSIVSLTNGCGISFGVERAVDVRAIDRLHDLFDRAVPLLPLVDVGKEEEASLRARDDESDRLRKLVAVRHDEGSHGDPVVEPDRGPRLERADLDVLERDEL
jgi:hypothetical protein